MQDKRPSWLESQWHDAKGNLKYDIFIRFGLPVLTTTGGWLVKQFSNIEWQVALGWIAIAVGIGWGFVALILSSTRKRAPLLEPNTSGTESRIAKVCDAAIALIRDKHDPASTFPIHSIQAIQEAGAATLTPDELGQLCNRIENHRREHPFSMIKDRSIPEQWLAILKSANKRNETLRTPHDVRTAFLFQIQEPLVGHDQAVKNRQLGDAMHNLASEGQRILDDWKDNAVEITNEWLARVTAFDKANLNISQTEFLNEFHNMERSEWERHAEQLTQKRRTLSREEHAAAERLILKIIGIRKVIQSLRC